MNGVFAYTSRPCCFHLFERVCSRLVCVLCFDYSVLISMLLSSFALPRYSTPRSPRSAPAMNLTRFV